MILSILICTMPERKKVFNELLDILKPQTQIDTVEVLSDDGDGEVGAKRKRLLEKSSGEYVCFVDDDDRVADYYVSHILDAIQNNNRPDCIGINGQLVVDGKNTWTFRHSITVGRWCKDKVAKIYFRTPNHLNPIKREYAMKTMFPANLSWGEDRVYSDNIRQYLKTEYFLEAILYYYIK